MEEAGQEKEVMKPVEQTVSLPPVADKKTEEKEENLENSQTKELSQISSHKSKEEIMETVMVAEANQDKKESTKAEENPPIQVSVRIVEQPEVEEGHIIVPILIPKQGNLCKTINTSKIQRHGQIELFELAHSLNTNLLQTRGQISQLTVIRKYLKI